MAEQKHKVGDWVKLVDKRPRHWARDGAMDGWLGSVIQIEGYDGSRFFFNDEDSYRWIWRLESIERMATEEEIKEQKEIKRKKEEERKLQRKKEQEGIVHEIKEIAAIAEDVFGKDRVSYRENEVIIYFPVIQLTNSREEKHTIKDLYVRYTVDVMVFDDSWDVGNYKANIRMEGIRGSISVKEYESNYGHSHLGRGHEMWRGFCLGRSEFSFLLENVRLSLEEHDWTMLFLSLENYLIWESLEGGPYAKIGDMKYNKIINGGLIEQELQRIIGDMPRDVWDFSGNVLSPIEGHPAVKEYFNSTSKIRDANSYSKEEIEEAKKKYEKLLRKKRKENDEKIIWKKKDREVTVYHEEIEEEGFKPVSKGILDTYHTLLAKKGREFIKKYTYDRAKQQNHQKVFGEGGTHQ